ncbi:MAG: sugar transferase [Jatrophihabitantaceae bacterium]
MTTHELAPSTTMASAVATPRIRRRLGKRLFDIVVAALLLTVLSPLLILVSVLVSVTSRGGPLYRQMRIGRNGAEFSMYKFRTMTVGCSDQLHRDYVRLLLTQDHPPAGGARGLFKLEADPRITAVGRILRRTSIDELPQLWNVLVGDMSLVGPRPALAWEAQLFSATHRARFLVSPGLTGLWQVSGRSRLPMLEGLDLDVRYVQEQSFNLDLRILLKTVPAVLSAAGAS